MQRRLASRAGAVLTFAMRFRCLPLCVSLLMSAGLSAAEPAPLAASDSEFVRAQAGSAVEWHAWNDATLAEAKEQKRCVYVFIGTPLSELTRATINQTFTSAKTVEWLNQNFYCIFVDGDARPDLAAYGQHYIRSIKQLQGSPVHLWLTPELQVYDGSNYLPPSEEWGKPGFLKAARSALDTWNAGAGRAQALANEALDLMRVPPLPADAPIDATAKLDAAATAWIAAIDPVNGGFGTAPKQPEPELIRFLLARGDAASRDAALNAARALVKGAARDPVDGGFYRRCIDEAWQEPYYQKTLLDQARIALALFDAADVTKDEELRKAGIGALNFVFKELRNQDGTFANALDGTLEESADATKRPAFVRVGKASVAARALLGVAMSRSGQPDFKTNAGPLAMQMTSGEASWAPHQPGFPRVTAADLLALALLYRCMDYPGATPDFEEGRKNLAAEFIKRAQERFYDDPSGSYQAVAESLPSGIALRVPASGGIPSAEVLALLAGVDAKTAARIRQALLSSIEYDDQPPGDVLLGLSQAK